MMVGGAVMAMADGFMVDTGSTAAEYPEAVYAEDSPDAEDSVGGAFSSVTLTGCEESVSWFTAAGRKFS